jgi:hypothetical protein
LIKTFNDVEVLYELDEIIESIELEIQKGISLAILGIDALDAFTNAVALINKLHESAEKISEEKIKLVALLRIRIVLEEFESKLRFLNTILAS